MELLTIKILVDKYITENGNTEQYIDYITDYISSLNMTMCGILANVSETTPADFELFGVTEDEFEDDEDEEEDDDEN